MMIKIVDTYGWGTYAERLIWEERLRNYAPKGMTYVFPKEGTQNFIERVFPDVHTALMWLLVIVASLKQPREDLVNYALYEDEETHLLRLYVFPNPDEGENVSFDLAIFTPEQENDFKAHYNAMKDSIEDDIVPYFQTHERGLFCPLKRFLDATSEMTPPINLQND